MTATFDDKFIDVAFDEQPEFTFGCKPDGVYASFGETYEDAEQPLTDAEVRLAIERRDEADAWLSYFVTRIYDQQQEGSCVGNATGQSCEVKQAKQLGKDRVVPLSPISLYKRIGTSANSGATISDSAKEITRRGILPLDTPENRARFGDQVMPHTGFRSPFPPGWEATGNLFLVREILPIKTMQGIKTAGVKGDPIIVGRRGHSIAYLDLVWNAEKGRFEFQYVNSWSEQWGSPFGEFKGGFGRDTESLIKESAGWAFAIRTIVLPAA